MSNSILRGADQKALQEGRWRLDNVEWHHKHGAGELIACSLRLSKGPFGQTCWIYLHVPQSISGRPLENNQVTLGRRIFGGSRSVSLAPHEINVSKYGNNGIIRLSNLRGEDSSYLNDINIAVDIPTEQLSDAFTEAERFCSDFSK
jgi:hypothetical protein